MTELRGVPLTLSRQLEWARGRLTVPDEVGLALRSHRRHVGMSQRTYARFRGLSRPLLARAEAGAANIPLGTVITLLEGTGFALFVGFADEPTIPPPVDSKALAAPVPRPREPGEVRKWLPLGPDAWLGSELLARVRGGSRRFPAHALTRYVKGSPPLWWWMHEFFTDPSNPPHWYAGSHGTGAARLAPRPVDPPERDRPQEPRGEAPEEGVA